MRITGKIIAVLPVVTGQGKNGEWKSQSAVIQTDGQYPKKVCFDMFGDAIVDLKVDDMVDVSFDIDSREYNGKWYTNIKAWKVEKSVGTAQASTTATEAPKSEKGSDSPF